MVEWKHPRYCWTYFHSDVLIPVTAMTILCMWSQGYGSMQENSYKKINCSELTTCKSCTTNINSCNWSFEKQQCENQTLVIKKESLMIRDSQFCPSYSVEKIYYYGSSIGYKLKISVKNNLNDFSSFLKRNTITCQLFNLNNTVKLNNYNEIDCGKYSYESAYMKKNKAIVSPLTVRINDYPIKLENDSDYYHTAYEPSCGNGRDDNCTTCLWHDNQYRYFERWCSTHNTCTGLWQKSITQSIRSGDMVSLDGVTELMCPEIQIRLIGPKAGVLGADATTVKFSVKDHWILAEDLTVTVTVAGRECAVSRTADDDRDTVTCVVSTPAPNATGDQLEGPIRVTYAKWPKTTFAVTSKQPFRFVTPVVEDVSTGCVPAESGYPVTITGRHMDAGNVVRVTVAERTECVTLSREPGRIVCVTGRAGGGGTATGRVKVEFDRSPARYANSTVTVYTGDAELDADQTFAGIASGGTAVPVRGRRFTCAVEATLDVNTGGGGGDVRTDCDVKNDTYMVCRSPAVASRSKVTEIATARVLIRFPDGKGFSPVPCSSRNRSCTFAVHPDPVFVDFLVESGSVVVNAIGSGRGYGTDDLAVRFPNSTGRCIVTVTAPDRVLCVPSSPKVNLVDLTHLVVTVGERFMRNLTRRVVVDDSDWLSLSMGFSWTFVVILAVVSASIIVVLGFCLGRKHHYNVRTPNDPTELQPVQQSIRPVVS